jgi:chemotaxis protein MotB
MRRSDDVDTEGSWALSYGDMITLLLLFFMIFFNLDPQKEKYQAMQLALIRDLDFKATPDGGLDDTLRVGAEGGTGVTESLVSEWGGRVTPVGSKILVEFPGVSFFEFGQVGLSRAGTEQLRRFVDSYLPYAGSYLLAVRAFTDNVPVMDRGRFTDNLELSSLRSIAALRQLQRLGIPLKRMRAEGYGELRLPEKLVQEQLHSASRSGDKGIRNARKIVLVIEPESEDRL